MRMALIKTLIVVLGLAFPIFASAQAKLTGYITHVRDGDTIEVGGIAVRLNGLTCDERGTALGDRAAVYLRAQSLGQSATCKLNGERTYDRLVGQCSTEALGDIGADLIARQLCSRCARYDTAGRYIEMQRKAGQYSGTIPRPC